MLWEIICSIFVISNLLPDISSYVCGQLWRNGVHEGDSKTDSVVKPPFIDNRVWKITYIRIPLLDVINHLCPAVNGGVIEPYLE